MNLVYIFLIAFGLAMDSFAVAAANGINVKKFLLKDPAKVSLLFGITQGCMMLIGWLLGSALKNVITSFDHWIAFGLLSLIGVRMIYGSTKNDFTGKNKSLPENKVLFVQAIATSIDALIVGTGLAFLNMPVFTSAIIISIVTLILSFAGFVFGNKLGNIFKNKAEIIGGIILIGIGTKILIEHLS